MRACPGSSPAPPYCLGQVGVAQPASPSLAHHWLKSSWGRTLLRAASSPASTASTHAAGRLARSHWRTSVRTSSSVLGAVSVAVMALEATWAPRRRVQAGPDYGEPPWPPPPRPPTA